MMSSLWLALALSAMGVQSVQGDASPLLNIRIGIDERLDAPDTIISALQRAGQASSNTPAYFIRLIVEWPALQTAAAGDWRVLDDRLQLYARQSVPVLLVIERAPIARDQAATWLQVMRAVSEHSRGRIAGYQIEATPGGGLPDVQLYALLLRVAAVQVRASDPHAVVVQTTVRSSDAAWQRALYAEGAAVYIDMVAIDGSTDQAAEAASSAELMAIARANDPTALSLRVGIPIGDSAAQGTERMLTTTLSRLGDDAAGSTFNGNRDVLAAALASAERLKDLLTNGIAALDDTQLKLNIEAAGIDVTKRLPHRLLFNIANAATYLVYWSPDGGPDTVTISLSSASSAPPVLRDPLQGEIAAVQQSSWDPATKVLRFTVRSSRTPLVLDFNYGARGQFASRTEVSAETSLSVDDIVFRNQQAQTAQARSFSTVIASLRTKLHFRASPTQVFDVISENRFFSSSDSVEWEELSFSVNGTQWGPDHPGLPLLQAEKVLTLPLDLRLTKDYRYRLDGIESVGDRRCYVVGFDPTESSQSRYRGRVWIDSTSFLRVKVQSIQTHLTGEIVSSEEQATYEPVVGPTGRTPQLVTRLSTKQILLVGGQSLLLEKDQWFSDFRIDATDFETEREAARASAHLMFRDTDQGVRYLVKRGDQRVVSTGSRTTSKALAMGAIIDPSFDFPLPIFGINYLNFHFMNRDSQLALLFGGVFVLGNIQSPKLGSTPFDASIDFFGIAVPGTDLRFDGLGERRDERVMNIPMSGGVNLGYQFSPFQKIAAGYSLRHDIYFRAPDTAGDFQPPASTTTHGATFRYELSRHGYTFTSAASAFARTSWKPWGRPGDFHDADARYWHYSARLGRDLLLGPFQTIHLGATWYGGRHLDRFSMYQFGLFDEMRMHGVPAAGVRFPELFLARGSYSFNIFSIYRLDLFVDQAAGRDPVNRQVWRPVTGTGVAVTLKTPWNTMLTVDFGKSMLPDLYRGAGSFVFQIMLLKPR